MRIIQTEMCFKINSIPLTWCTSVFKRITCTLPCVSLPFITLKDICKTLRRLVMFETKEKRWRRRKSFSCSCSFPTYFVTVDQQQQRQRKAQKYCEKSDKIQLEHVFQMILNLGTTNKWYLVILWWLGVR